MNRRVELILFPAILISFGLLLLLAQRMPGLVANTTVLGELLVLEIVLVGLSHFDSLFFPLLMVSFLWAGTFLPFHAAANSLRWLFLAVGACAGFAIWIKSSWGKRFAAFHLVALFCVASALVSAMESELPSTALLKVASLFLLFLYASAGARLAVAGREKRFISGLVLACEWLVYLSAISYFVLHFPVFGNPNALGAAIGVVAVPVLLWAALSAQTRALRRRRFLALLLCGGLLYLANSRASTLGATIAILSLMIAARYQRLLFQCALVFLCFFTVIAVFNSSHMDDFFSSITHRVIYKDADASHEILESRLSPWAETVAVIHQHPWFGSGFGTSELEGVRPNSMPSAVRTTPGWSREHGSSYLALAEYLGLFGALPFVLLLLILLRRLIRGFRWIRSTSNPSHLSVPIVLVLIAGLVHAGFEDWLFAVGSYLCVFFWICAFLLTDLLPAVEQPRTQPVLQSVPFPFAARRYLIRHVGRSFQPLHR
jgi:O-antigen ligase